MIVTIVDSVKDDWFMLVWSGTVRNIRLQVDIHIHMILNPDPEKFAL